MLAPLKWLVGWLTRGGLDRILSTVEKHADTETQRQKLRAEVLRTHLTTRPDFMRAGGFVLMLLFAVPLAVWFAMVIYDSAFGCLDCVAPNDWSVAALPPPLDEWAGIIITAIFGVSGLAILRR